MPETPYSKDDLEMMLKREVERRRTAEKERDEAKAIGERGARAMVLGMKENEELRHKVARLEAALTNLKTCHTSTGFHRCDACKRILDAALSGETGERNNGKVE